MERPGPWSRACTGPTVNIVRWYPRWFPITASIYSYVDVCVLGRYYTYLDIRVERVISINIEDGSNRFIQALLLSLYASISCLLYMYTQHSFWCLILFDHINTCMYLSLHDTWLSPTYSLGSFWLPWTCMFRFWSLDWRGALHWRSSLSLGAGWLVLAPSVPDPSC